MSTDQADQRWWDRLCIPHNKFFFYDIHVAEFIIFKLYFHLYYLVRVQHMMLSTRIMHFMHVVFYPVAYRNRGKMFQMFVAEIHSVKVNYIKVHTRKTREPKSLRLSCAHCQLLRRPDCEPYNTRLGRECYTKWKLYAVYEERMPGVLFRLHSV